MNSFMWEGGSNISHILDNLDACAWYLMNFLFFYRNLNMVHNLFYTHHTILIYIKLPWIWPYANKCDFI